MNCETSETVNDYTSNLLAAGSARSFIICCGKNFPQNSLISVPETMPAPKVEGASSSHHLGGDYVVC